MRIHKVDLKPTRVALETGIVCSKFWAFFGLATNCVR